MKKLAGLFEWIGFIVQYIVPVFLFSDVIPFIVENPSKAVTAVGYICIGICVIVLWRKAKQKIIEMPKAWWRALILSIPPIVVWLAIWFLLGTLSTFIVKLAMYWDSILLYVIIGRVCVVVSETLYNIEPKEHKKNESAGEIDG
jgi:hypothetical protein